MKHRHQLLFLCLFCCTFTFMIPFTTSKFFVWRMVWSAPFPLSNLSCLPLGHSIHHRHQAAQLSAMDIIIFFILPKCLSTASPRWIYFLRGYRSLRGSPFPGKAMSSISSGLLKALRSLSRNLCHWCNFSCGLRFNSFAISLLWKKPLIILILSLLYWECRALYHVL